VRAENVQVMLVIYTAPKLAHVENVNVLGLLSVECVVVAEVVAVSVGNKG